MERFRHRVIYAFLVLAWSQEEEECDPGKVINGLLVVGSPLGIGFEGVEDGDWGVSDSWGSRIFSVL